MYNKLCCKIKKNIFESLLKLFTKKMSLIISLIALFINIINYDMFI